MYINVTIIKFDQLIQRICCHINNTMNDLRYFKNLFWLFLNFNDIIWKQYVSQFCIQKHVQNSNYAIFQDNDRLHSIFMKLAVDS